MHLSRLHVSIFLGIAAITWGGLSLFTYGIDVTFEHLKPFGTTVGVMVFIGWLFEHHLWKMKWLYKISKKPNLTGTWSATLISSYVNPDTQKQVAPIECFVAVTQSFSQLKFNLMTKESQSWFVSSDFVLSSKVEGFDLMGIYTNEPRIELRQVRSEIHYGALRLEIHGSINYPTGLTGEYWTDRLTKGSMSLKRRIPAIHTSFSEAQEVFFVIIGVGNNLG